MLAHNSNTVYLSLLSTDLPLWHIIESRASLYQKNRDKFHLLLKQKSPISSALVTKEENKNRYISTNDSQGELLWLEISPYRVIMTMQSQGKLSYRHFWEKGIYGTSRYWLNDDPPGKSSSIRLRNFTRYLKLEGQPLPTSLQIEYELWSAKLQLGCYVLHLDIDR